MKKGNEETGASYAALVGAIVCVGFTLFDLYKLEDWSAKSAKKGDKKSAKSAMYGACIGMSSFLA